MPADTPPDEVAYSIYEIEIRPGIRYQPHPAFAKTAEGDYVYHQLTETGFGGITTLGDFSATGSRELVAADYVYQIKRLAHPNLHSPIFGLMSDYIVGLKGYAKTLEDSKPARQDQTSISIFRTILWRELRSLIVIATASSCVVFIPSFAIGSQCLFLPRCRGRPMYFTVSLV